MSRDMRFPTIWYVDQQSLRSTCAYAQSDQSLCLSLEYSINVKLLTEHHFEFPSLKGDCMGSSESTPVKMPHCWKSHVVAYIGFLCKELHIIPNEFSLWAHDCPLPVDKHNSVKHFTHPSDPLGGGQMSNILIAHTKSDVNIFTKM